MTERKHLLFALIVASLLRQDETLRTEALMRLPPPVPIHPTTAELPLLLPSHAPPKGPQRRNEKAIRESFAAGRYEEAEKFLREDLSAAEIDSVYKAWLDKQLLIIKTASAWMALQKRDCKTAQQHLEGIHLEEAPALAAKALGYCSMQEKDWASAEQYLHFYTEKQATDAEGFALLSEVKEAQGSYTEAIDLNQQALSIQGDSSRLTKKSESLNAQQEESLTQAELSSGSFKIRYQTPMHYDLAYGSLEILNQTLFDLNDQLGLDYPSATIEITFHKSEHFERITHSPSWAAALYDGQIRIPISENINSASRITEALRHEIMHAVLDGHVSKRKLPSWFQEGMAQIAECPGLCWTYQFSATSHPFLPSETFQQSFLGLSKAEAQVAYKQSRYLIALLYKRQGIQGIKQLLEQLPQLETLDSDDILRSIDWSFATLYDEASRSWLAQKSL